MQELEGEGLGVLDLWAEADAVILVDCMHAGAAAGTVHRLDAAARPLPAELGRTSSHTISIAEVVELARSLGRLPPAVIVFGIEGSRFDAGAPMQPAVSQATFAVAEAIRREADRLIVRSR